MFIYQLNNTTLRNKWKRMWPLKLFSNQRYSHEQLVVEPKLVEIRIVQVTMFLAE